MRTTVQVRAVAALSPQRRTRVTSSSDDSCTTAEQGSVGGVPERRSL
jgi:hypothetical protein